MPSFDEIRAKIDPNLLKGAGKFQSKMNFTERCEILAFEWLGVSRRKLAKAYNVNRSTVNFIINPASPHYKDVRRRFADLGKEAFIQEYATAEALERVNSVADDDPEVLMSNDEIKAKRAEANSKAGPNKNAKSHEGEHRLRDARWEAFYFGVVEWSDDNGGWVFRVPGKWVDTLMGATESPDYYHNPDPMQEGTPAVFRTSKQALDSWLKTWEAELV